MRLRGNLFRRTSKKKLSMAYKDITESVKERILVLDGATGTMIQRHALSEADFTHPEKGLCRGLNDLLCLTRPNIVADIHRQYLEAGADIISTNTFNANAVSLADYGMQDYSRLITLEAARIARTQADKYSQAEKPRYVAGVIGPTGRTASISPDVEDPSARNITFDELFEAYGIQAKALAEGGADLILIETVFDSLNAKAAVAAVKNVCSLPIMLSGTITDASGRLLSGQTVDAFFTSFARTGIFSIGLNCALGAGQMKQYIRRLAEISHLPVSSHPNAGLPDGFGGYAESASQMADTVESYMADGLVNIIGGCCGTTPEYISLISHAAAKYPPRKPAAYAGKTVLAGLEPLTVEHSSNFVNVGERANVAGSAKFARLVREGSWDEAVDIVKKQAEDGAQIIDVCMDAPMIDAREAMTHFLKLIASEPDVARLPLMIDSSSWDVLLAGMKCVQGKHIINSISLKNGENEFLSHARTIHSLGCAAVVMLFDEKGQADTYERKVEVAQRMYRLLTEDGFPACDIIFDPNILAIATGIPEHDNYAADFIRATSEIKRTCPGVKISGGVSNLSFSFRGNNTVREAMHSVFLYHAIEAGMDMGIVNAGMLQVYSDIDPVLLGYVEDVILNRRQDAGERLTSYAQTLRDDANGLLHKHETATPEEQYPDVCRRLAYKIVKGITDKVDSDAIEALKIKGSPVKVIDEVLMDGMGTVGELFGQGKMFLPQVVKSARVMKLAVDVLTPFMERGKGSSTGKKILLATVKGDVHDIGKNIVSVVMSCNGYRVIDLGVMVEPEKIVDTAVAENADIIGLSGLITPSLEEMANVVRLLEQRGLRIPVMVGGATTSKLHTAVKIAPLYSGTVACSGDASDGVKVAGELIAGADFKTAQQKLRDEYRHSLDMKKPLVSIEEARSRAKKYDFDNITAPRATGIFPFTQYPLEELRKYIDWSFFFIEWGIKGRYPDIFSHSEKGSEARRLYDDANRLLDEITAHKYLTANGILGIFPARSQGEDIIVGDSSSVFPQLRNQSSSFSCLSDFISPATGDHIGMFAVTAGLGLDDFCHGRDNYTVLMAKILANRMAEAFARIIHEKAKDEFWGFPGEGIRPACGYPSLPDHTGKRIIFDLLDAETSTGIRLTENYMMTPEASVSGLILAHPQAGYFAVGPVSEIQLDSYARRRGISFEEAKKYTGTIETGMEK